VSLVDLLPSRALNLLTVCRVCERSYRVDRVRGDRGSFSARFRLVFVYFRVVLLVSFVELSPFVWC
jgi:uncharacterized Fe-S radical SAM superfamily protein PflX